MPANSVTWRLREDTFTNSSHLKLVEFAATHTRIGEKFRDLLRVHTRRGQRNAVVDVHRPYKDTGWSSSLRATRNLSIFRFSEGASGRSLRPPCELPQKQNPKRTALSGDPRPHVEMESANENDVSNHQENQNRTWKTSWTDSTNREIDQATSPANPHARILHLTRACDESRNDYDRGNDASETLESENRTWEKVACGERFTMTE